MVKANNMVVKIKKLSENAILPEYQTEHAAAMDLCACINEPIEINPMQRLSIPTGIAIELPIGYESQIRPRSGLSLKNGITMVNGVGTIDSDYRGEYHVLLINFSDKPFTIEPGMRIAQLVIAQHEHVAWDEVNELNETGRGKGGFGSTGLNVKG